jgi:hypothetical protein
MKILRKMVPTPTLTLSQAVFFAQRTMPVTCPDWMQENCYYQAVPRMEIFRKYSAYMYSTVMIPTCRYRRKFI